MLRSFLRLFAHAPQRPSLIETDSDRVEIFARVQRPPRASDKALPAKTHSATQPARPSHRERLLSMRLEHTKICSPRRCERLRDLGVATAGDLACANPERLATHFGAPNKALRVIKHYRRAIRLSASVPGMMPRDALLLISIHRRSVRGLAIESPAALHRDLERFAESTRGRVQLRGRRIPSTRRLRRWIVECESCVVGSSLPTRVA